jgi:hypothetical protein
MGGLRYQGDLGEGVETVAQCGDGREYPWGNAMPRSTGTLSGQRRKALRWHDRLMGGDDYAL